MTTPPTTPNPLHTLTYPSALLPNIPALAWPKRKDPGSSQWYWVDFTQWLQTVGTIANEINSVTGTLSGGDGMLTVGGAAVPYSSGTLTNNMVAIQLDAGTAGETYTVGFGVVTSEDTGSVLALEVRLVVDTLLTL